ncbi:MAG: HsdM family class I SAM-dependent methyltransferase [Acidimicrobiales bacterium]
MNDFTPLDGRLQSQVGPRPALAVIGAVAVELARRQGQDPEQLVSPTLRLAADAEVPADAKLSVHWLGLLHEHGQSHTDRRKRASHYTPADVARRLVTVVRGDRADRRGDRLCDPTVGGGAFLLAGADALAEEGVSRREIVEERLWGADIDLTAVEVTRTALALWAGVPVPEDRVTTADTLTSPSPWALDFEVVVGNPPFLSPLARETAPDDERRGRLRERFGEAYGPYVDAAALFLLVGLDMLAAGGRMGLVQPLSFLAARDTEAVRTQLLERSALRGLWVATDRVFGAAVEVCAPVVESHADAAPVRLYQGRTLIESGRVDPPDPTDLAPAAAPLLGIPPVQLSGEGQLGDRVSVTAGFRDEYYAIAGAVREGGAGPRVVTAGRIGPLRLDPQQRPVRIQRRDYTDPRLDLEQLAADNSKAHTWVERLLVPKILVATQSPVVEVVVDPDGGLVPLTPVLAVLPPAHLVWEVAAYLAAPSVSALLAARTLGLGRHTRVVKVAARDVRGLPGPPDSAIWADVGRKARRAQSADSTAAWLEALWATATAAEAALGTIDDEVTAWWAGRLGMEKSGAGLRRDR